MINYKSFQSRCFWSFYKFGFIHIIIFSVIENILKNNFRYYLDLGYCEDSLFMKFLLACIVGCYFIEFYYITDYVYPVNDYERQDFIPRYKILKMKYSNSIILRWLK